MGKSINTIADIAEMAGVSKSTVSRALNDSPLISQKTKTRIKAIAQEHQFETHQGARCLSLNRSQTIALIIPVSEEHGHVITDPFFVELLRGMTLTIADYGYDLLIGQPRKNVPGEISRYIGSKRADGIILLGCWAMNSFIAKIVATQAVIVWGADVPEKVCSVDCDNLAGGRLAAQHLLQIGRRRIAFLGGYQKAREVELRYQGYAETLKEAGCQIDPALVLYGDYTSRSGYELTQQLLQHTSEIDAVFASSDLMAIGAMEALRENGRSVPDDIAVVGFDDVPLTEHCSPPLTTIRQHIAKAGEVLIHNLMQFLKDGIITRTILPVELVVRKSSSSNVKRKT